MERKHLYAFLLALLLFSAGLALRLFGISDESLHVDEMYSLLLSRMTVPDILGATARDFHPPLYYLILKGWAAFSGETERELRLLSVLFGLLCLPVIYAVGKRLHSVRTGLFSAFILALSLFNIHYSQNVRGYTLLALLSLLSWLFFLKMAGTPSVRNRALWLCCAVLLVYTHVSGFFLLLAQPFVYLLRFNRPDERPALSLKQAAFLCLFLLLTYLPWGLVLRGQVAAAASDFWIPRPSFKSVAATAIEFSGTPWLALLLAGLALFACLRAKRSGRLLVYWLALPPAFAFIISWIAVPVYTPKVLIGCAPALYLLAGRGLAEIQSLRLRTALLALLLVLSGLGFSAYYRTTNQEPWREAAARVYAEFRQGDALFFYSGYCREVFEHYARKPGRETVQVAFEGGPVPKDSVVSALNRVHNRARVWLVLAHTGEHQDFIRQRLSENFLRAETKTFPVLKHNLLSRYDGIVLERYDRFQPNAE